MSRSKLSFLFENGSTIFEVVDVFFVTKKVCDVFFSGYYFYKKSKLDVNILQKNKFRIITNLKKASSMWRFLQKNKKESSEGV